MWRELIQPEETRRRELKSSRKCQRFKHQSQADSLAFETKENGWKREWKKEKWKAIMGEQERQLPATNNQNEYDGDASNQKLNEIDVSKDEEKVFLSTFFFFLSLLSLSSFDTETVEWKMTFESTLFLVFPFYFSFLSWNISRSRSRSNKQQLEEIKSYIERTPRKWIWKKMSRKHI